MIVAPWAAWMTGPPPPVEDRDGDPSAAHTVKSLVRTDKPLGNEIGGQRNALSIRLRARRRNCGNPGFGGRHPGSTFPSTCDGAFLPDLEVC
jgi:hypothetical protein